MSGTPLAAAPRTASERELKAVFLFNFARFVEWPPTAFANERSPFCIGVLGQDPFGSILDEVVRDEVIGDRPFIVQRFRSVEEVTDCQLLFVSRSETNRQAGTLAALSGKSILTVSDNPAFAAHGGMIRFVTERGKIRLHINVEAARAAGLKISSLLLRPATIVTTGGRED